MTTPKTKRCQLQGEGCLGEFEPNSGQGGSNRKYCDNCQKLASRKRSATYNASLDPEKVSKKNKDRRRKVAKAAGRPYREMTSMQPCLYLDREGKPGKDCVGEFKPKSGIQMFCDKCQKLAIRDRQCKAVLVTYHAEKAKVKAGGSSPWYEKHLQRGRKSANAHHKRQKVRLAKAEQLVLDLYAEVDAAKQAVAEKEAKLATAEKKLRRAKAPEETSAGKICRAINAELPAFKRFFATPENVEALRQGARSIDGLSKSQTAAAGHAIKSKDSTRWPVIAVRYFVSDATGVSYDVVARYHQSSS